MILTEYAQKINYKFNAINEQVQIFQTASHEKIKTLLLNSINSKAKEEDSIKLDDVVLTYLFEDTTLNQIDTTLQETEEQFGRLKQILVEIRIRVNVYYQEKKHPLILRSYQTLKDLQ